MSHDFLILTDLQGSCIEVGSCFQKTLKQKNITIDLLNTLLAQQLPMLLQGDSLSLPLSDYGIHASPFFLLHQDTKRKLFIAEDQTVSQKLLALQQQTKQAELRHREKEQRIHTLLDESSDPIFSFKVDGTYLYVNKVFARTLGYKQNEIIDKKIWDIFPQEEADRRFAAVQKAFKTGNTDNIEVRIPLPDGDKYFLTTVKPIKDAKAQVSFVICISKDISDLRETERHLKTLQGVLPICSACKNIRNDAGSWEKLEVYISHHSEAEFTHGICPDCAQKLYPFIY